MGQGRCRDPPVAGGIPEQMAGGGVHDGGAVRGLDGQVIQVAVVMDQDGGDGLG